MRLTPVFNAAQFATLSSLFCIWCSPCCINCCPPSLRLAWTQSHSSYCNEQVIMTAQPGAASANHLAYTVAMKTVSSNHVAADQVFRNITTLPHLHTDFAAWYILIKFDAALQFGSGILLRMCVWARGWGCSICSSVWFVNGYVSFPLPPLLWFLEAAQRPVISSRECCIQELTVCQDHHLHHQLHWRRESPSAQRSGPLTGYCTRRGAQKYFFLFYKSWILCLL